MPVAPAPSSTARMRRDLLGDFVRRAVGLAEQDRRGVEVVAGLDEGLDGGRGRLVHHLQPGGNDAGGDDRRHRLAGAADVVEGGHDHLRRLGLGHQLDGHLGHHGEQALGADHQRQQVVARRIERCAAELDDVAVHGDAAHAQHVVHRQAVLEAMHAAGVLGDVAADGAGDLRTRIGRVVETVRRGGLGDGEVAHARLDHGDARDRIEAAGCASSWPGSAARLARAAARRPTARCRRRARPPAHRARWQVLSTATTCASFSASTTASGSLAVGGQAVALVGLQVLGVATAGAPFGTSRASSASSAPRSTSLKSWSRSADVLSVHVDQDGPEIVDVGPRRPGDDQVAECTRRTP